MKYVFAILFCFLTALFYPLILGFKCLGLFFERWCSSFFCLGKLDAIDWATFRIEALVSTVGFLSLYLVIIMSAVVIFHGENRP